MQRPQFLRSRSDGRFYKSQIRSARGLNARFALLDRSWSTDTKVLDQKKRQLIEQFDQLETRDLEGQALQIHQAMEAWDTELDRQIAFAERELLLSVRSEAETQSKLEANFSAAKLSLRKKRDSDGTAAQQKFDSFKESARQSRDGIRQKIEIEKRNLSLLQADLAEWMLLHVGRPLRETQAKIPVESLGEIQSIQELPKIAKSIEEAKRNLSDIVEDLKKQAGSKNPATIAVISLGPVLGLLAAGIAWAMSLSIIFVAIIAVIGSIVLTAILYFATRLMAAKSVQKFAPQIEMASDGILERLQHAVKLADAQFETSVQRASQECQNSIERINSQYKIDRDELHSKLEKDLQRLRASSAQRRWDLTENRRNGFQKTDEKWQPEIEQHREAFTEVNSKREAERDGEVQNLYNRFLHSQTHYADRWKTGSQQTNELMQQASQFLEESQPAWNSATYLENGWKRDPQNLLWRIGVSPIQKDLSEQASQLSEKLRVEDVQWPVAFDLMYHGALVLHGNASTDSTTDGVIDNVLLRAITSLPAGSMRVTVVDPQGLGKKYSWLMALADVDPSLVGDRVWTQPLQIADQLGSIARGCEDVIQQSLRNIYPNLFEYNLEAGPMAQPYRLIVWDQFPVGLDDNSWQSLCSILAAGGRCGVGVILRLSSTQVWPSFADPRKLEEFGLHLDFPNDSAAGEAIWETAEFKHAPIYLVSPPSEGDTRTIMEHHLEQVTELGRIVVPFESILLPQNERQETSSADSLQVPIGIAASGRTHSLKLGHGTAQHVLIAGKTGSGKSSLLHTLISSAALKYSPDELRLVLLDFKKGVEFQVYSESKLPHADVIGIESKREFGVSTLEYLDRIMHARGEAFRSWGVQDLPSLHRKFPQEKMPRILIVIDEFQELFVEDDKLSQQASMLMDRIVRQGRSFGIHLVLASQTLGGAYSLPRTTLAQMAVRIALQCDSSDAMLILGEDNTAAERLRYSGQAIYNDAGGRIENNQGFQVAYIDKDSQMRELARIPTQAFPHTPTINPMGRQLVFEGHKPALWDNASMERQLGASTLSKDTSFLCVLGDSVSIDPPVVRPIPRAAGRSLLIVGPEERMAASLLAGLLQGFSLVENASAGTGNAPKVYLLNGARAEDVTLTQVIERANRFPFVQSVPTRDLEENFATWKEELDRRLQSAGESHPPMLFYIANLARFRELRKGDEFSFGDSSGTSSPDAVLSELLKDGPAVGMHTWIWADSAGTLGRWLSRQSMRDLELRILMQMSANDSNQLIDSNTANKLEAHVAVFQDEMDGKPIKFRPFAWDSLPLFMPQ